MHRRSLLLQKDLRGTAPPKRQCMQLSCTSILPTVQRKKRNCCVQRTNLFLRVFYKLFLHAVVWFSLKNVNFLSKRKQALRKDLFFAAGGNGRTLALARPHFAWFRKPWSWHRASLQMRGEALQPAQPTRGAHTLMPAHTCARTHRHRLSLQCEGQQAVFTFSV